VVIYVNYLPPNRKTTNSNASNTIANTNSFAFEVCHTTLHGLEMNRCEDAVLSIRQLPWQCRKDVANQEIGGCSAWSSKKPARSAEDGRR
jgi:hypothetical protein